jgi:hypothetical protein
MKIILIIYHSRLSFMSLCARLLHVKTNKNSDFFIEKTTIIYLKIIHLI